MGERIVYQGHLPHNTGLAWDVARGQHLRIYGQSIGDFVCFNRHNLRERFDQGRTKTYGSKIWITTGDVLMSKSNNPMLRIVYDGYAGTGTHDLQKGMCSGGRFQLAAREGRMAEYYNRDVPPEQIPDHGCWENLSRALEPHGIPPEDVPSPFNLFQNMKIDCTTGSMFNTNVRPGPGTYVEFVAEMDLLCALSACPDITVGGKPYDVVVLEVDE